MDFTSSLISKNSSYKSSNCMSFPSSWRSLNQLDVEITHLSYIFYYAELRIVEFAFERFFTDDRFLIALINLIFSRIL